MRPALKVFAQWENDLPCISCGCFSSLQVCFNQLLWFAYVLLSFARMAVSGWVGGFWCLVIVVAVNFECFMGSMRRVNLLTYGVTIVLGVV